MTRVISLVTSVQLHLRLGKLGKLRLELDAKSHEEETTLSSLSSSESDLIRGRESGQSPPKSTASFRSRPHLSLSKPSLIVRTESNVHKEIRKKPHPICVVCNGTGRVHCHQCSGKGRTNFIQLEMLPKGEWPKWCKSCGGSGLSYCSHCLGTGEYRYIMGFQFMRTDANDARVQQKNPSPETPGTHIAADQRLNVQVEQVNGNLGDVDTP